MAIIVDSNNRVQVTEVFSATKAIATGQNVTYSAYDTTETIRSDAVSPAVPVSKFAYNEVAMTAGALTLDLTALVHQDSSSVDGTGLKLQKFRVSNPSTNSNNITLVVGASNPYDFMGDASGQVTLAPGAEFRYDGNETLEDIDSTHCEIDVSGNGTETVRYTAIMG